MVGRWNLLLGWPIFSGYVSSQEGILLSETQLGIGFPHRYLTHVFCISGERGAKFASAGTCGRIVGLCKCVAIGWESLDPEQKMLGSTKWFGWLLEWALLWGFTSGTGGIYICIYNYLRAIITQNSIKIGRIFNWSRFVLECKKSECKMPRQDCLVQSQPGSCPFLSNPKICWTEGWSQALRWMGVESWKLNMHVGW